MNFIFTTGKEDHSQLIAALCKCGGDPDDLALCETGSWGSIVATPTRYRGLAPLSDERHLHLVVGDPLIELPCARDRAVGRTVEIAKIWERIIAEEEAFLPWHPSLLLRVCKQKGGVEIVTDPASFIALYRAVTPSGTLLATSPDLIAALIKPELDMVSVRERLASGQISYPYSLYRGIEQLPPGSIVTVEGRSMQSRFWWSAPTPSATQSVDDLAQTIRDTCKRFLSRLAGQVGQDGILTLSAGGDTRFIADVVAETRAIDPICVCTTAVDNYESWTARQVAQTLDLPFVHHIRPTDHHALSLLSPPLLIGTQVNWEHCHFDRKGLGERGDAGFVIGGYMADSFLVSGDSYTKARRRAVTKGILDPELAQWATHPIVTAFTQDQRDEIVNRRNQAFDLLNIDPAMPEHLQSIWPFSRQWSKGHFEALRREYPAYEFFMTTPMVETGLSMSDQDKLAMDKSLLLRPLNRKLSDMPFNPESAPPAAKAISQFKKHYPKELWPESLIYAGAWSERQGAARERLNEAIAQSRTALAAMLGLDVVETHDIWCYGVHQAMQLSAVSEAEKPPPAILSRLRAVFSRT